MGLQIQTGFGALQEPQHFQAGGQTQCHLHVHTRILLTYQGPRGPGGEWQEEGLGPALTEDERLNVRLRRRRRLCFLRLLRWLR